ncbi:MAG: regulatory signaling modulator protein AmpE [Pseudomonadota bacterium]|nr:regulatory signaling modulator protein AmpE [Pseudomonadota bacterium]
MKLVVLLVAYLVRRRLDARDLWAPDPFWRALFQRAGQATAGKEQRIIRGLVMVLLPAMLVFAIDWELRGTVTGLWLRMPECLLLILLIGAPGWQNSLRAYGEAWQRGDMQGAWHIVCHYLPAEERGDALSPDDMHRSLSRALIAEYYERYFLMVFWYVVGGIGATLLVAGLLALRNHWPQQPARRRYAVMVEVIGWIPSRLLAITFGVAGDLGGWQAGALTRVRLTARELLFHTAETALTGYALNPSRFGQLHPDEWRAFGARSLAGVRGLLTRSMLVWICLVALLVIAGWA